MSDILPFRNGRSDETASVYTQRLSVPFEYDVHFSRSVFATSNRLLLDVFRRRGEDRRHRVFIIVDSGVSTARPGLIRKVRDWFHEHQAEVELAGSEIVPGGEIVKTDWQLVKDLMVTLGNQHLDRQSFVLAIGGGSVLDMAGFVTALVHRGLRLVRLPTTVLSQNDAGVGVKNGMNEHGVKNFVGTFAPPFAVVNDFDLLDSLSDEHWRGGISEAFKVAIIKDREFFDFLVGKASALKRRDTEAMEELIRRCAILHLEHIAGNGDPFEVGTARPLDFGHWSAHKLESLSDYRIPHGQAVATGVALDSYYAYRKELISRTDLDRIISGLVGCGLPVWYPEMSERNGTGRLEIVVGLDEFREHLGGELTITLPKPIGSKIEVHAMDEGLIEEAVAYLRDSQRAAAAG